MLRKLVVPVVRSSLVRSHRLVQPRVFVPVRQFSDESHWTDIFKKKAEGKEEKKDGNTEAKTEEQAAEPVEPVKEAQNVKAEEAAPVEKTSEEIKEEMLSVAKAKMAEQAKQIEQLKRDINKHEMAAKEYNVKIADLKAMVLREKDELNNLVERNRKDVSEVKKFGVGSFCKSLLEGVDTLEMCLAAGQKAMVTNPNDELSKFIDGISMTSQMFAKILAAQGITKYESVGLKADPALHFVTAQLPHPTAEEGEITYCIKEGYMIHDRVLRPAQVCIASPKN